MPSLTHKPPYLAMASLNNCDFTGLPWGLLFENAKQKRKCDLMPLQDGGKTGFKTRVRFATVNSDWVPARTQTVPDNNQTTATYWLNSLN